MSTIIVGNSSSLRDHSLGAVIDNFSTVVRINTAPTHGYEEYVGTKTDYLFMHKTAIKEVTKERLNDTNIIVVSKKSRNRVIALGVNSDKVILWHGGKRKARKMTGISFPGAGISAVCYCLYNNIKPYIIGIEGWFTDGYYYNATVGSKTRYNHSALRERKWIQEKIKAKELFLLNDR